MPAADSGLQIAAAVDTALVRGTVRVSDSADTELPLAVESAVVPGAPRGLDAAAGDRLAAAAVVFPLAVTAVGWWDPGLHWPAPAASSPVPFGIPAGTIVEVVPRIPARIFRHVKG